MWHSFFFRRLIFNISSRCLAGGHRTLGTLCFKGSYYFPYPCSLQNLASKMEMIGGRSRLYICTISHLLVVKKKKPNHFARSKFDRNFTTGLNKLSRIVGSKHTLQCLYAAWKFIACFPKHARAHWSRTKPWVSAGSDHF